MPPDYVAGPHNCGHNLTVSVSDNYVMHVAGYLRDTKRSGTEYSLLTFFHPISSTVRQADSVEDNGQPVALRWRCYKGQAEAISLQALCKIVSRGNIFVCFLTHTALLAQYCAYQASRLCHSYVPEIRGLFCKN